MTHYKPDTQPLQQSWSDSWKDPTSPDTRGGCCMQQGVDWNHEVRATVVGWQKPELQNENRRSSSLVVFGEDVTRRRPESTNLSTKRISQVNETSRGLVRTGGGLALCTCPTCRLTRFDAQVFPMLLMRRLQMPFPLAGVATSSMSLAITAQLAHASGSSLWKAQKRAFAARRRARHHERLGERSGFGRSRTGGDGCQHSSQSTQTSSALCAVTGQKKRRGGCQGAIGGLGDRGVRTVVC